MRITGGLRRARGSCATSPGFTLVELMITLVIMIVVLAFVYSTFFHTQREARGVTRVVEARQGARAAVQIMEREVRMAGSGWGRITVNGSNSGVPMQLHGIDFGYGGPNAADSLSVLGAWGTSTRLRADMTFANGVIPCDSASGFQVGDMVVVTNEANDDAHLFQVTGVNGDDLQHDASSPFNVLIAGTLPAWPLGGYGTGADVYKVDWVTYFVDSTTFRRPALVRRPAGGTPALLAFDVDAMEIWYQLDDDTETRDPANLASVARIVPRLRTRVTMQNGAVYSDSIWASIRPRTF
jgi:prepilin-type N-terminal cleavage/methylation domain-containing protein